MYYVDSQRTVTQRESSLLARGTRTRDESYDGDDIEVVDLHTQSRSTHQYPTKSVRIPIPSIDTQHFTAESPISVTTGVSSSIERQIVTSFFESMLPCIVQSWEVIPPPPSKHDTIIHQEPNNIFLDKKKKEPPPSSKPDKRRKSRSSKAFESMQTPTPNSMQIVWWSEPDEKAVIYFKNGNLYEGNISMKCMNGEGRFQWADGSIYLGHFKDNAVTGKGKLQWKDDCWYEGDFLGNVRHGKGVYVDPHRSRSYCGDWNLGTKHGNGVMFYSIDLNNHYDGEWQNNVRQGQGIREYCKRSGYNGSWDFSVKHGKGIMIWPNRDFYAGDWRNGLMSGYGRYLWDVFLNNTMTLPSLISYDGQWLNGERNGFGTLELGFDMGSLYQGEFKNMKKHGLGHLITNNGLILRDEALFNDDLLGTHLSELDVQVFRHTSPKQNKNTQSMEPYPLKLCDDLAGLRYHIHAALLKLDRQIEIRASIVNKYFENNKHLAIKAKNSDRKDNRRSVDFCSFIRFEEYSLLNQIKFYEPGLKDIYNTYSNTCTTEKVAFAPVLIRLFLWQFYYDCDIPELGLSLVDNDNMFHKNRELLSLKPHNPFEPIQFWQFLHSLILVSNELFAKRYLPGPNPDTILAEAFKYFMDNVALPASGRFKGPLNEELGSIISLKGMYKLYQSIGEPHSVRDFLCAARRSSLLVEQPQPEMVDAPEDQPKGRNVYLFGDKVVYLCSGELGKKHRIPEDTVNEELRLYNFGNLSSKSIINIFADILPGVCEDGLVLNLDVKYTFFEFFLAFIGCAEKSVRVKEEENRWRDIIGAKGRPTKRSPRSPKPSKFITWPDLPLHE